MPLMLPFGSWPSPLTAAGVAASSPRIEGARFVGDEIWWAQSVPLEGGRTAVRRRRADGRVEEVLPAPFSARSRVHEYGGGAWTAIRGELIYAEKADQRLWALTPGGKRRPLTPEDGTVRFGGLTTGREGSLLAVRERHSGAASPRRDLVSVPLDGSAVGDPARVLSVATGSDFLAQPALSPDGTRLAWVAWDRPDMPWDAAELRVGEFDGGRVVRWERIGEPGRTAALQPVWTGEDELTYADDRSGRWNLWRSRLGGTPHPLAPADADTGGALWSLGSRWFAALGDGRIVAVRTHGSDRIVVVDGERVDGIPLRVAAGAAVEDASGTRALVSGATAGGESGLWLVDLAEGEAHVEPIAVARAPGGQEWHPRARSVQAPGRHGIVHAFAYPPSNPGAVAPDEEKPPYLVLVHGGPTAHVGPVASARIAYFTSRGIGVLDVNYGGSTGYGRAYRERLRGQWGVVDVDDVVAAAEGIAEAGLADPARIAIAGGSAGGWTVLSALARTEVFSAGISRYGVGDARALAAATHDFEARYLDGLIGPLPDAEEIYLQRSPLSASEGFSAPLLILQGAEDAVVPPSQAEAIRDALAARGIAHAYLLYEGEGHGFRRAETLEHALESELGFLAAVWAFTPPGVSPLRLS